MKQYLEMLKYVMENGVQKGDRTGTGTLSTFGYQYRHNLNDGFPLLTTKKVYLKGIVNELIWFLNGGTNKTWLNEHGVKIWDEWATDEGDLGPIYGKMWTAWPTKNGGKINQIEYVMDLLKNNPESRRILFHGWNPEYLPDEGVSPQDNVKAGLQALPPCHLLYQFQVANNKLSLLVYIRSNDLLLGHPYNLASAACLLMMVAQQANLAVGEVIMTMGDAHIYSNHIEQVQLQLSRTPHTLPTMQLNRKPKSIYDYKFEDFELSNYDPHPAIAAPIAI
ncbi:MAG: thymidylate synthase [Thiohalomonadales bacterium]